MSRTVSRRLPAVLIALLALSCNPAAAADLPTSARAEAAIAAETPLLAEALAAKGLRLGAPVYIAIYKAERVLEVWSEAPDRSYRFFKAYPICAMSGDLGPKLAVGDQQAPEGFYAVGPKQLNPGSHFHLAFNLGYPNAYDRAAGRTGSALMVHGNCLSVGCFAMTDAGIDEIYTLVHEALAGGAARVPVHIFPFRMTPFNMSEHARSPFQGFWSNLKEGYDAFQASGRPPRVGVANGRYAVISE